MSETSYCVYALKDPRSDPAKPFYVGKGTGVRAWDHLAKADETRKGRRIQEIRDAGSKALVAPLVEGLSESQAMRLEAELISAFGTEDSGGILTNAVLPSGLGGKARREVVVPLGSRRRHSLAWSS